jgi:hypothetical protein
MIKAIIAILNKLACPHKWDLIDEILYYSNEGVKLNMPSASKRLYCCPKCGKFKKIRL